MISVIIPVYNAEKHLPDMLDSVLRQSYTDIEMILVNDGSTDSSGAVCHAYAERNALIRVFDRENQGVAAARGYGISQAAGDFIWLMDSDDILCENALESAVNAQLRTNADVVVGGMEMYLAREDRSLLKTIDRELTFPGGELAAHYAALFGVNYISSLWNKLIRRTLITENEIRMQAGLSMYEDYLFSMDVLCKASVITCCPDIYYKYMLRDNQSLSRSYKRNISGMFRILKRKISEYLELIGEQDRAAWVSLNNLMIYLAFECVRNEFKAPQEPRGKVKALLRDAEFSAAMQQFRGYGLRYRAVHLLMKHRLEAALILYLERHR